MTTKALLRSAFAATVFTIICLPAGTLSAQSIPPVPEPTPGTPAPESGPTAHITMDDDTTVSVKSRGGRTQRVLLYPGQTASVMLRYEGYAGGALTAVALDSGRITVGRATEEGIPLQFDGVNQPGLYRILLNCGGSTSLLQFWVPEPEATSVDDSILVPQPLK